MENDALKLIATLYGLSNAMLEGFFGQNLNGVDNYFGVDTQQTFGIDTILTFSQDTFEF